AAQKQKWAMDPRNNAWTDDDFKFGQRMLEKMRWSKGKSLGAQEQGATDHIKVQIKNSHLGLGATVNNEELWIAHHDDFNQLLSELNTCHGQETADTSNNKKMKSFSVEEKSKISKNCVHYMKFTGKDLSSLSKTNLDCILGKRQSKKTLEDDSSPSTPDEKETSTTTSSAFTIQEYFSKCMAELNSKPQVTAPGPDVSGTEERKEKKQRRITGKIWRANTHVGEEKHEEQESQEEAAVQMPHWEENSDVPAEAVEKYDDQHWIPKPQKRREKKKLQKPVEGVDVMLAKIPVKKKKGSK
uniref:G-patch domain-containing protein n=1 Tax=Otolemur garnettii TaxID=30611 RepID=H0XTF6_OTOGA